MTLQRNTTRSCNTFKSAEQWHEDMSSRLRSTLLHTTTCCNTRQHTATHGTTLHHPIRHCNTLCKIRKLAELWYQCIHSLVSATRCNTLQHTATLCNTLQHSATHCNTLQHTTTHCNTLQHARWHLQHTATLCNTPHHTATHYYTMQHTPTHCNTLTRHPATHSNYQNGFIKM